MKAEIYRVHDQAKEISGSKHWAILLKTMRDRIRFEDGYLKGWMDCKKYYARIQRTKSRKSKNKI